MNGEYSEFEEFNIPVSVGHPLHNLNLVVRSFQGTGRDGVVIPVQDAKFVNRESLAYAHERLNAGSQDAGYPGIQGHFGLVFTLQVP